MGKKIIRWLGLGLGLWAAVVWAGGGESTNLTELCQISVQPFLVSPVFEADGESLRVRGRGGLGCFRLDLARGDLQTREPQVSGLLLDESGWQRMGDFRYRIYDGRIERWTAKAWKVLVEAGAWGPVLSPDGNRLVFNTEGLLHARLWLAEGGSHRELAHGAQQLWLPDSSALIFSQPSAAEDGRSLAGSRLILWYLQDDVEVVLTQGPGCPMQPALSPDGKRLAWSDWHSGAIYLARLDGMGVRP
ncbi:MAG: PD40 domain-containing protein [Deltaproteobacteria bacterium]|nr:PD40 domain-containing protein [Deltaproteobacteria bacterium]